VRFRDGLRRIRVTEFGSYEYCESFEESLWKKVIIARPGKTVIGSEVELIPKGASAREVAPKKLADIIKQMPFIPPTYRPFYSALLPKNTESDVTLSASDDSEIDTVVCEIETRPRGKKLSERQAKRTATSDIEETDNEDQLSSESRINKKNATKQKTNGNTSLKKGKKASGSQKTKCKTTRDLEETDNDALSQIESRRNKTKVTKQQQNVKTVYAKGKKKSGRQMKSITTSDVEGPNNEDQSPLEPRGNMKKSTQNCNAGLTEKLTPDGQTCNKKTAKSMRDVIVTNVVEAGELAPSEARRKTSRRQQQTTATTSDKEDTDVDDTPLARGKCFKKAATTSKRLRKN